MSYDTLSGAGAGNLFRQNRSAAPTKAHSGSDEGSGVAIGACTFPDPVVPSKRVTSNVLARGAIGLSKINPDSGAAVNVPLFSRNDTNSTRPSGVSTVSMVLVKSKAPPGAVNPETSIPGVTAISSTASSPVSSATV